MVKSCSLCLARAQHGNVVGSRPKVIGTGPTVLTSSWVCALQKGVPGSKSIRTTTLQGCGLGWTYVGLGELGWTYVDLYLFEFD